MYVMRVCVSWRLSLCLFVVVQIACAVVVFGYVAGVDGEINFTWLGVIFGACSSVGVSLYSIFSKKYMAVLNGDQWLLLYYNNVNSMILMPFISLAFGEHSTCRTLLREV